VGGFIMLWGLVVFARFMRSHPVQSAQGVTRRP
jgi:hypothetical protein